MRVTRTVIQEILPHLRKGALLCDITSVKQMAMEVMVKAGKGIGVVSMHPLFGPKTLSLANQRIVVCPVRPNKWWWRLKAFFEDQGALLVELTPEEHDRATAYIQGAMHFCNLLWASLVQEAKDRWPFLATPTFLAQSYIFGRIC